MKIEVGGIVKFILRHIIAAIMIPVGVILGVGGLIQHFYRKFNTV